MKNIFSIIVLSLCMAVPSFAGDVVGHGVKVAGKDSAKAATVTAKDSAKAATVAAKGTARGAKAVGKFLF